MIKVTEPRAGQPGLKVAISKAAPATTQPCYKADLEGVTKKEVAGDQTNVQAKNKGPRCPPVDGFERQGGKCSGVPAQGTSPNSPLSVCLLNGAPSFHCNLIGRFGLLGLGGWRQAPPLVKLREPEQLSSEFLGAPPSPGPPATHSTPPSLSNCSSSSNCELGEEAPSVAEPPDPGAV